MSSPQHRKETDAHTKEKPHHILAPILQAIRGH